MKVKQYLEKLERVVNKYWNEKQNYMVKNIKKIYLQQKKRYLKSVIGTPERPRLAVFRSHKHVYAQIIDDKNAHTLAFASTLDKNFIKEGIKSSTQEAAFKIGELVAKKATEKEITKVSFDRGNKPYHGRIKNIAEGARKAGLVF